MYYIVFCKMFAEFVFGFREYEWTVYCTENKEFAIEKAKELNNDALINITTEYFKVYCSTSKKYNKKTATLIYP